MAALTSPEGVCNLALGLLGHRQFLDSLNEQTTEAAVCRVFYESTRNHLLARYDWSFARKKVALGLTQETRDGWAFCYSAPADMLEPRRIWDGNRRPGRGEPIPFDRELNNAGTGLLIVTDQPEAVLLYTAELATVALWSPAFVTAVAAQLAVAIAGALSVKPALMPQLERGAALRLLEAAGIDATARQDDEEPEAEHIRERG